METMFLPPEKGDRRLFALLHSWAKQEIQRQPSLREFSEAIFNLEIFLRLKLGDQTLEYVWSKLRYWFALANSEYNRIFSRRRMLLQIKALTKVLDDLDMAGGIMKAKQNCSIVGPNPPSIWFEKEQADPVILRQVDTGESKGGSGLSDQNILGNLRDAILGALAQIPDEIVKDSLRGIPAFSGEPRYEWALELRIPGSYVRGVNFGYLLWALSTAFENVPGVEVVLEEIGMGSFWAKLGIGIQDTASKIEVEDLLKKSVKALEGKFLDKTIEEAKKTSAEVEKLRAETEAIKKQFESSPTKAEHETIRRIELADKILALEERREKLRGLQLQNQETQMKLAERTAYLLKEGIIMAGDGTQISINGVPLLTNSDGKLSINSQIEDISNRGFDRDIPSSEVPNPGGEAPLQQ
jgi:hypothetical protein